MNALVAGIGNIFLGDDGFGPEVIRRLAGADPVPGVRMVDYGIRGLHLAYDLLAGCDLLVLVDALPGAPAGEIVVLAVGPDDLATGDFDPHGMNPVAVLGTLASLGGTLPPTVLVGCRAASVEEGIGLSPPVAAAVPQAIDAVDKVLADSRLANSRLGGSGLGGSGLGGSGLGGSGLGGSGLGSSGSGGVGRGDSGRA